VWSDSVTLCTDVLAKYPTSTLALDNRAQRLMVTGQFDRAVVDFAKVVTLSPRFAGALRDCGGALYSCGRHREALAVLDRGVALDSTDRNLCMSRGTTGCGPRGYLPLPFARGPA